MISSSLQTNKAPTVRWGICRNIFLTLIALQMVILIYIGFAAPSVTDHFFYDALHRFAKDSSGTEAKLRVPKTKTSPGAAGSGKSSLATASHHHHHHHEQQHKHQHHDNGVSSGTTGMQQERQQVANAAIGPYDVPGAFFSNFELERMQPGFRNQPLSSSYWTDLEAKIGNDVQSCLYYSGGVVLRKDACTLPLDETVQDKLLVYNPLSFDRTFCGETVPAQSHVPVKELCKDDTARLIGIDTQNGKDGVSFQRIGAPESATMETIEGCDVPCSVTMDVCPTGNKRGEECLPDVTKWTIGGREDWEFSYSRNSPYLRSDRKAFRSFKFGASHVFESEIPLSEFSWEKHGKLSPPVDFATGGKSVTFLSTDTCHGQVRADSWAKELRHSLPVDGYGDCAHSIDVPAGMSLDNLADRQQLLHKNLFALVVGTTTENDVIPVELWEALQAGAIPVFYGASNIKLHVPHNSIVNGADVGSKTGTAELLLEITKNRTLWESYHSWRQNGDYPDSFRKKYGFLKTRPFCRMCRWAYSHTHGLGWNHTTQEISATSLERNLCMDDKGMVGGLYQESWSSESSTDQVSVLSFNPDDECKSFAEPSSTKVLENQEFRVERTWVSHNGVLDMIIPDAHADNGELTLDLEVPIENWDGAHFANVHQLVESPHQPTVSSLSIQDRQARVTILTNWPTTLTSPTAGTIHVPVLSRHEDSLHDEETRRIRLIVEDLDVRDVMTEYSVSPYAWRFVQDFMDPLVLLYKSK